MTGNGLNGGKKRATIIGGSMGGLFAALLLNASGWEATVYERNAELSGRGAGIVTHPELFDVLRRARIDADPAELGVSVPGRRVYGLEGAVAGELGLHQVLTSWGRLYALLRDALPPGNYRTGRKLAHVEERPDGVEAHFSDGSKAEADVLIGADGLFSTVREQFLPDVSPNYVGYIAWRGLVEEATLSPATRAALTDWFAFCLPPGEQMLGYPVAGADESVAAGRRRFNFVWYRPAAPGSELRNLLTDVNGVEHALSIPPNVICPNVMRCMRDDADRLLAPQFAEVVRNTEQPFIQAIMDLASPRLALGRYGRVAILGDAAFVARPHVGMGVTKAAADAAALADALITHPSDPAIALAEYERRRLPAGNAVIRRARELGAYMQAQILTDAERELAERHRSPTAVLAETAVATGWGNL